MIVYWGPARPRERRKLGRDGAISRVKPALATADHAGKQDRNGLVRSSPGLKEVEQYFRMPAAHITEPKRATPFVDDSPVAIDAERAQVRAAPIDADQTVRDRLAGAPGRVSWEAQPPEPQSLRRS